MPEHEYLSLFPEKAKALLEASGRDAVAQAGMAAIKNIVHSVLIGRNLRDSTEWLTRKRLATLNTAMLVALIRGQAADPLFIEKLPGIAAEQLVKRNNKYDQWLLNWVLGLTGKGIQNVLRDEYAHITYFKERYTSLFKETIEMCRQEYGNISGNITLTNEEMEAIEQQAAINWDFLLQLMITVGAQTLTIRGSDKSTYGKLFEILMLGSLLHIFGFNRIKEPTSEAVTQQKQVFWLSSTDKRECDATALLDTGRGIRFDIGFIGRGNSEISLDKVTRFTREIELGPRKWYVATIIIVDTIGKRSKLPELAERVDGTIIQMSGSYWPVQLAKVMEARTGYHSEILDVPEGDVARYLAEKLREVPFEEMLRMSVLAGTEEDET